MESIYSFKTYFLFLFVSNAKIDDILVLRRLNSVAAVRAKEGNKEA